MALLANWSRSDSIAAVAAVVAGASFLTQCADRGVPYDVQNYIDQGQASREIVGAVEDLIGVRQVAMISVEWNVFEPDPAMRMSLDQMNKDARVVTPVVEAFGRYQSALQNNARFYDDPATLAALASMDQQAAASISCFANLASARNKVAPPHEKAFRELIASTCNGANLPASLNALKAAEARAMAAMEAERTADREG